MKLNELHFVAEEEILNAMQLQCIWKKSKSVLVTAGQGGSVWLRLLLLCSGDVQYVDGNRSELKMPLNCWVKLLPGFLGTQNQGLGLTPRVDVNGDAAGSSGV